MVGSSGPCKILPGVKSLGAAPPPLPPLPEALGVPRRQDECPDQVAINSALAEGSPAVGIGALCKTAPGVLLPTIFQAAKDRKSRAKEALAAGKTSEHVREVDSSDLCLEGRSYVKSWAFGLISGRQCMFRLQFCSSAIQLLQRMPQRSGPEAALWLVGFANGAKEQLETLQHDLETKSPSEMLLQAWEALEAECGAAASRLDLDEINLALKRLSVRRGGSTINGTPTNPSAFLRVQIWRELIRIHLGTKNSVTDFSGDFLDDAAILELTKSSDQQLREFAKNLEPTKLLSEAERLSSHASRMIQMEKQLRLALQEWTRFDPWKILGVSRGASLGEVRRAFFKRALQLHPDKGGGTAQFQELQRAYDEVTSELGAHRTPADDETEDPPPEREEAEKAKQPKKEKPSEPEQKAKKENDDGQSGNFDASEERQAFTTGKSMKWLECVAAKVAAAAEAAGDRATASLRNCHNALEALEQTPTDCLRASANLDATLRTVRKLSQATSLAARFTSEAADAIEVRSLATFEALESLVESTRETATAVKTAANHCLATIAQVSEALKNLQWTGPGASTSQGNLTQAVTALSESCKKAAVVSIEAAEAVAQASPSIRKAARVVEDEEESPGGETEAPEEVPEEVKPGTSQPETTPSSPKEKESSGESVCGNDEGLESRKALAKLQEARRLLQRSNRGILQLQQTGRKLAMQDTSALPTLCEKCHERTFNLLAEFLDEAARRFHETLTATATSDLDGSLMTPWILKALDEAFCFWLRSTPALAVPSDPRSQILRAAIAMDSAAVRNMQAQVSKRIEGVVSLVLLESKQKLVANAQKLVGHVLDDVVIAALNAASVQLSNSLSSLEQGPE